jgi:hypothetical protein
MSPDGQAILKNLGIVAAERGRRSLSPELNARVVEVKRYQHARFEATYGDLLASPRYAKAARFFLEDLYGPRDFTLRDDQFARIVPGLVRLFPANIVGTVRQLSELHALSEELDSTMAAQFTGPRLDDPSYALAWRATGRAADRERQIVLMGSVGAALDRYTRNPLLRHSLRLMRGPAKAAGLSALHEFLESGFDTFGAMRGAGDFLGTIESRERALAQRLFDGGSFNPASAA